jgi:glutamine synthetase
VPCCAWWANWGDPGTRIENRLGEPLANPYLYIASQMFAGLDGIAAPALQPVPATEDPYAPDQPALPVSLADALQALAADAVLQQGLGPAMARVFHAIKRQEIARQAQALDPGTVGAAGILQPLLKGPFLHPAPEPAPPISHKP